MKFEGNINGVEYNDVTEFRKALSQLDDPKDLNVSYRMVDDSEQKKDEPQQALNKDVLYRKFDVDSLVEKENLDEINVDLDAHYMDVINEINKMTSEELYQYQEYLTNERNSCSEQKEATEATIKKLTNKREAIDHKLNILKRGTYCLDNLIDFYNDVLDCIVDDDSDDEENSDKAPADECPGELYAPGKPEGVEGKEVLPQKETTLVSWDQFAKEAEGLFKLLRCLF